MRRLKHSVHDLLNILESLSAVPRVHPPYVSRESSLHLLNVGQWFDGPDLESVQSVSHAHRPIGRPIVQTDDRHRPSPTVQTQ